MRLYLGLDKTRYPEETYHLPLIKITPLPFDKEGFSDYTHLLFTSRTAITFFAPYCGSSYQYIVIGPGSREKLEEIGHRAHFVADPHTAEGVVALLEKLDAPKILFPHAKQARALLPHYVREKGGRAFPLYDTEKLFYDNPPPLANFTEIIFTSPMVVEAFVALYGKIPKNTILKAIGPITEAKLRCYL